MMSPRELFRKCGAYLSRILTTIVHSTRSIAYERMKKPKRLKHFCYSILLKTIGFNFFATPFCRSLPKFDHSKYHQLSSWQKARKCYEVTAHFASFLSRHRCLGLLSASIPIRHGWYLIFNLCVCLISVYLDMIADWTSSSVSRLQAFDNQGGVVVDGLLCASLTWAVVERIE